MFSMSVAVMSAVETSGSVDGREARSIRRSFAFASGEARAAQLRACEGDGALIVHVDVHADARGRLSDVLDEAIEAALEARGAAGPGIGSASDADAALSDQLFRARRVGATGIAIALGSLRAACSPRFALEPEDSATLRFWLAATQERPVVVVLEESDRGLSCFGEPRPLAELVEEEAYERAVTYGVRCEESASATGVEAATSTAGSSEAPSASTSETPPDLWRPWVHALSTLRGPQPLATFEKLFAKAYLPLVHAIAMGLDDSRALAAREEFRRTFQNAYQGAFPTFGVTGKRPKMVLDAPELAAKAARLHGARAIQLLLVDAMRWDLGAMVRETLTRTLDGRATLTEEMLLFSALPSTTPRQLDSIARGMESLRNPPVDSERDMEPRRGRTAEMIRRVRAGSRDLYKLDVVEARLREAGVLESLPDVASVVADAIERHASALAPRTLLFVFGDHGFTIGDEGETREGGASPEEVMVPAFAWLVGDVH
jgi:hypothetical protein